MMPDEVGDDAEDGDFDEDLAAGWGSEEGEATEAVGFEVAEHAAEPYWWWRSTR